MIPNRQWRRAAALEAAAALTWPQTSSRQLASHVLAVAEIFDEWLTTQPPVASFTITADTPTPRANQEGSGMSLTFPDSDFDTLRINAPVDSEGEAVTGTFTWSVDNTGVLVLTPATDTMSCVITPGTVAGSATVTATTSDGVVRTFAVDITTGPVADFSIVNDGPQPRTAPAAPAPAAGA